MRPVWFRFYDQIDNAAMSGDHTSSDSSSASTVSATSSHGNSTEAISNKDMKESFKFKVPQKRTPNMKVFYAL